MAIDTYEEALVFAAKNGNTTSFEELYRLYYKKVYALIRMTVKDPSESEDVLQQTFVNAWKNISKLEDNSAFNTWIQRIAVNQCYSVLRKHKEMLTTDSEEQQNVMDTLESDFMLPEVYATQQDLSGRLKKIISELSDVQRQTILLYYYNEMSIDEIAETMGCSPGTVKSRLYLARKAIGTEIEEQERKTGQRFFAVAGIPVTAFRGIFGAQVDMDALPQKSAMQTLQAACWRAFFAIFRAAAAGRISRALISRTPIHWIESMTATATRTTKAPSHSQVRMPRERARGMLTLVSSRPL